MSIRLVIVDDHPIILEGLQRLFESNQDFQVLCACENGEKGLAAVRTTRPDVLLLDLRMRGATGLDVLETLSHERLDCRTVLLTAAVTDDDVVKALQLGVMGLVLKESAPETLVECVRRVHAGERWIEPEAMSRAFDRVSRRESAAREIAVKLTPRELEIVHMVAEGLRNRRIAERLFISEGTVKIHLHNIYEKLGVDGRLELAVHAREKGLV